MLPVFISAVLKEAMALVQGGSVLQSCGRLEA